MRFLDPVKSGNPQYGKTNDSGFYPAIDPGDGAAGKKDALALEHTPGRDVPGGGTAGTELARDDSIPFGEETLHLGDTVGRLRMVGGRPGYCQDFEFTLTGQDAPTAARILSSLLEDATTVNPHNGQGGYYTPALKAGTHGDSRSLRFRVYDANREEVMPRLAQVMEALSRPEIAPMVRRVVDASRHLDTQNGRHGLLRRHKGSKLTLEMHDTSKYDGKGPHAPTSTDAVHLYATLETNDPALMGKLDRQDFRTYHDPAFRRSDMKVVTGGRMYAVELTPKSDTLTPLLDIVMDTGRQNGHALPGRRTAGRHSALENSQRSLPSGRGQG